MYPNSETAQIAGNSTKLVTSQLGEIEYAEDTLIDFENGIIGFENCHRFVIVDKSDYEPFRWLFTIDGINVGLPIVNPFNISSGIYEGLPARLVKRLFASDNMLEIFCIVNLNGENGRATMNLKSPIILDYQNKKGKQLILESDKLSVSQPIW